MSTGGGSNLEIFSINPFASEPTPRAEVVDSRNRGRIAVSPDGASVYYSQQVSDNVTRLVREDLRTGLVTELASGRAEGDPYVSRDGLFVLASTTTDGDEVGFVTYSTETNEAFGGVQTFDPVALRPCVAQVPRSEVSLDGVRGGS